MKKDLDKSNKWRLTGKNLKFLQYLVKGMKVVEAHRLAGYSGNEHASYALKCKLKGHLAKLFETEGISRDRYLADLLGLLSLPCVDKNGNKLTSVNFTQYMEIRKALRDELPSSKANTPNVTAFVIQRFDGGKQQNGPGKAGVDYKDVIDITPVSGRGKSDAT